MTYDPQLTNASNDELLQLVYMDSDASPRERELAERFDTMSDYLAYERGRVEEIQKEFGESNAELQEEVEVLRKQIEKARQQLNDVRYTLA